MEASWYLVVEGRPEPVLAVFPRDRAEAIRIAFDVGNRHFSLALEGETILVPDDTAMEQLLTRLGVRVEAPRRGLRPHRGRRTPARAGTSPLDGHTHAMPASDHHD